MSPCEVEIRPKGQEQWLKVGKVKPGDPPGSISDVSKGERDIYLFECAPDDSHSTIYRSRFGVDSELGERGEIRVVEPIEGLEEIKKIEKGESFELELTTERGHPGTIRFRHR